ncbi:MAG: LamG domain-containing protein, partial [Gammaproteobacteria bacterium]|nr:LamG domain-containing protein [Gammaproteobacteria bacterium]
VWLSVLAQPAYATYERSTVAFDWVSTAGHTMLSSWAGGLGCPDTIGDDSISALINVGFTFRFGATAYTQVRVQTNGRLQFNNTYCGYGTQAVGPPRTYTNPMPNANLNNVMRIYGADLDLTAAGSITYATTGTAPDRRFVVTWSNVSQWRQGGANNFGAGTSYNLQIQLHESGDFLYSFGVSDNITEPTNTAMGPAQVAWQLTTSDFQVAQSGLPANNTTFRYRRIGPDAHYRMDESSWPNTTGDVLDASGNAQHGSSFAGASTSMASPALSGSPGSCGYGVFDGVNDYVEVPNGPALNGDAVLTYAAWIRPTQWSGVNQVMAKSVHGGGSGRAQMGMFSESGMFKGRAETLAGRYEVQAALPSVNQWTHVALVFAGTSLTLYYGGTAVATTAFAATTLVRNADPLAISKRVGTAQYFFSGNIDEVRVYRSALTQAQVAAAMAERRTCPVQPGAARFLLSHAGYAINCQTTSIVVSALTAAGALVTNYAGLVTLTTQSGRGSWSLGTGSGTLVDATPNDGLATYQFVLADGGRFTAALYYPEGSSPINVNVFQSSDPTLRDDDTEGALAFSANGFTVTANALTNPPPNPINDALGARTAGSDFALHIAAYGQTPTDPQCGIIESYTGAKSLRFWMDYVDPTTGTRLATVNAAPLGASEAGATAHNVTFTQGQASVTVKYKDVGQIRLQLKDAAALPSEIRGSSNSFVVRPSTMAVSRWKQRPASPIRQPRPRRAPRSLRRVPSSVST